MRILKRTLICLAFVIPTRAFADPPVTDGILFWLDATDPTTVFQDDDFTTPASFGDFVGGWKDKSGNEFHATQPDEFRQPVYEEFSINDLPTVRLSGADSSGMIVDDGLSLFRPYTAFIVNQYNDAGPARGRTLQSRDINWLHGLWAGNFGHYAEGWVGNAPAAANTAYVLDTVGGLDESSLYVNGRDFTTSSAPLGEPGRLGLGSEGSFPAEVSDADVSEIIIYDRVLEPAELEAMRAYLYGKYDAGIIPEPPAQNIVLGGAIGAFEGGDAGEGLDFEGEFVYALDVGGFGGQVVGDAEFSDASEAGMQAGESEGAFITDANEILDWHSAANYGNSDNDADLESVMRSIRWNVPPGLDIDLEVENGNYQLQLLFAESCCNRGFDIEVEGDLKVDNFAPFTVHGGINNGTEGAFFTDIVTVSDGELNIQLGGASVRNPDNNPILNGLTLEFLGAGLPGDFNSSGELDVEDIDLLSAAVRAGNNPADFDLNGDNSVDGTDREVWVNELKFTWFGDADLDGVFNSSDLVLIFQVGEFEDEVDGNSTWGEGDWDGDGDFTTTDFVVAFQAGGFEVGPREAVNAVPEPNALLLAGFGLLALTRRRRCPLQ